VRNRVKERLVGWRKIELQCEKAQMKENE